MPPLSLFTPWREAAFKSLKSHRRRTTSGVRPTAFWLLALWASFVLVPDITAGEASTMVTVRQPVHPVLIRNDHSAISRVAVQVDSDEPARLTSLTFTLAGTDDLNDIESLSLFATRERERFYPRERIGNAVTPADTITFKTDIPLRRGINYFWLVCRLKASADLSHRIGANCTQVRTTTGEWVPEIERLSGPRQRIGFALRKAGDDGVHTYRIPALATAKDGTLLCVYDMRRRIRKDLQEDIDIGLSRSEDGGKTWQPVKVIMDMGEYRGLPQAENGVSDPGIIVDVVTGEISVFAVWMHGKPGKHQWNGDGSEPGFEIGKAAQVLVVKSRDHGRTWSSPENLTRQLKQHDWWLFAPCPQQGITLSDGTLVMPAQGRDENGVKFSTMMLSEDRGKSWRVATPAYSNGSECQAVELRDGSIMLNMRTDYGYYRAVYVTDDRGKTWKPHLTNRNTLIEPVCNGSLVRVDYKGKRLLLFSNPHTQSGRTHQTVQLSFDEGTTWPRSHHRLLDEGSGAGYPSLTRIDDEHVGIVYEGSQAHLVFERMKISDLILGRYYQ